MARGGRARIAGICVIAGCAIAFLPGVAAAAPGDYVLVSDEATVTEQDSGETVAYTIINLTGSPAPVALAPRTPSAACAPTPSPATLPASREQKVTFTLKGCDVAEGTTLPLRLTVNNTATFDVTAKPADAAAPDWGALWSYPLALLGALVTVITAWSAYGANRPALTRRLPGLSAGWSFKDSWAANVTLVTALFTGVFGSSDLLTSIAGEKQPDLVPLVTIGSALGLALIGAAPLLLQTLRTKEGQVRVIGLLASAVLALGAAAGLVLLLASAAASIVSGAGGIALYVGVGLAMLLLAAYGVVSIRQNLALGIKPPPTPSKKQVATAVKAVVPTNLTEEQIEVAVAPHLESVEPPYLPSMRPSALL